MSQVQTTDHTRPTTSPGTGRRPRTIAWGTTIAGAIALGLAVLVGLTEIAGLSIPFGTAGPGAVIVVGLLILLIGLVVVIRSGRRSENDAGRRTGNGSTPPQVAHTQVTQHQGTPQRIAPPPSPVASSPLDMPADPPTSHSGPRPEAAAEGTPPPPAPTGTSREDGPTQSNH